MTDSNVINGLAGGALIGIAAAIMLLFNGRIAGVSGISKGLLSYRKSDWAWRFAFVGGLVCGGALFYQFRPDAFQVTLVRPLWVIALAGSMVGFGTSLGNGCTSGHAVCGVSRLSPRSIVATATFMLAGFFTVAVYNRLVG